MITRPGMTHTKVPVQKRQKQEDHCEIESNMLYIGNSQRARITEKILSQTGKLTNTQKKERKHNHRDLIER